jgi:hypothetical protein
MVNEELRLDGKKYIPFIQTQMIGVVEIAS